MIRVSGQRLNDGQISPLQCGQFIEFISDLVRSLYGEKVFDNSFMGLEPYLAYFIKQKDFRENPWYPSGAVNRGEYVLDEAGAFNGRVSQKIGALGDDPCVLGISQDGIFVEEGKQYVLSVWLRQNDLTGPVNARIARGKDVLAACAFDNVGDDWSKFTATLTASGTHTDATLTFDFRGPATIWLDKVSLMPVDTVDGWRPDAVEAVRAMKPGIIRFGGTAVRKYYEWEQGIGDPDHRVPFSSPATGGLEPNNVGIDEFIAFCRAVEAEPLVCVRFTDKTPQDAANQVEYCNGSVDTPYGRRRAENGHPNPYGVKYWQVGNEVISDQYDRTLIDFCKAMKAVDPSIKLLSSYPTAGLLKSAGQYLDYTCPHPYFAGDMPAVEKEIDKALRLIAENAPGNDIKLALTEWNASNPNWGTVRAELWTLDNALKCARFHNYMHEHCDRIEIAIRSNLAHSFCIGALHTDNARLYKTPVYYAQSLYANHARAFPLTLDGDDETLSISATLSRDGKQLAMFVVNQTYDAIERDIDISALGTPTGKAEVWTLGDTEGAGLRDVTNSFDDPERVSTVRSKTDVDSSTFSYTFAPLTLTVLKVSVR